jgi:hypothetical protein
MFILHEIEIYSLIDGESAISTSQGNIHYIFLIDDILNLFFFCKQFYSFTFFSLGLGYI